MMHTYTSLVDKPRRKKPTCWTSTKTGGKNWSVNTVMVRKYWCSKSVCCKYKRSHLLNGCQKGLLNEKCYCTRKWLWQYLYECICTGSFMMFNFPEKKRLNTCLLNNFPNLTFRWPCFVINSYNKTN